MCSVNALDRIVAFVLYFFLQEMPWPHPGYALVEKEREREREREREWREGGREGGRACVIMALLLQLRYRSISL